MNIIKQFRKEEKLTMIQLSELSGLSQSFISQVENGKTISNSSIKKVSMGLATDYYSKSVDNEKKIRYYNSILEYYEREKALESKKLFDEYFSVNKITNEDRQRLYRIEKTYFSKVPEILSEIKRSLVITTDEFKEYFKGLDVERIALYWLDSEHLSNSERIENISKLGNVPRKHIDLVIGKKETVVIPKEEYEYLKQIESEFKKRGFANE